MGFNVINVASAGGCERSGRERWTKEMFANYLWYLIRYEIAPCNSANCGDITFKQFPRWIYIARTLSLYYRVRWFVIIHSAIRVPRRTCPRKINILSSTGLYSLDTPFTKNIRRLQCNIIVVVVVVITVSVAPRGITSVGDFTFPWLKRYSAKHLLRR